MKPNPCAGAVGWLMALLCTQTLVAQDLTITNARIIVGTGEVIDRGVLVVRGGRIASVSRDASGAQTARAIDARGMTVMSGLIDAHRHIINGNEARWFNEQAVQRMQEFLDAGYTTLMSGGGPVPGIVELKRRIDSGMLKGPRIVTSGRADPANFKTPETAREQVRKLADAGVEIIKAAINPKPTAPELQVLAAVTDESHKRGLKTMVHAVSVPAMLAAVKAGADKLVHTPHFSWLSEEDARVVKDAGIPTLSTIGFGVPVFGVFNQNNVPTFRDGKAWPDGIIDGEGRGREAGYKAVNARTLWDAGVTYGFGTDTNYQPLAGLAHELRALNLMGPNTAAFIEKTKDVGTVEVGKLADLIILDGNPLDGYWNFLRARVVIKGGEIVADKR